MTRKKLVVTMFTGLLFAAGALEQAYGRCGCGGSTEKTPVFDLVTRELNRATAVFSGKVVRFEWRRGIANEERLQHNRSFGIPLDWETKVVILKVDQWWKPSLPDEVALVTEEVRMADGTGGNSSCNYNFVEGKSYLVFASGPENELRSHACAFTRPLDSVSVEMLEALGKGNKPARKFEADKPQTSLRFTTRSLLI